jgi:hypothetical protein
MAVFRFIGAFIKLLVLNIYFLFIGEKLLFTEILKMKKRKIKKKLVKTIYYSSSFTIGFVSTMTVLFIVLITSILGWL